MRKLFIPLIISSVLSIPAHAQGTFINEPVKDKDCLPASFVIEKCEVDFAKMNREIFRENQDKAKREMEEFFKDQDKRIEQEKKEKAEFEAKPKIVQSAWYTLVFTSEVANNIFDALSRLIVWSGPIIAREMIKGATIAAMATMAYVFIARKNKR
jgi:hypothetical protein